VNVDTGQFAALVGQVAELTEQVRQLTARETSREAFFAAGVAHGEDRARGALLGRAGQASQAPRRSGPRPAHLRPVDGSAS
jgi:hypothetical protein